MHLVKWDIFKIPVIEGGLQIRDPRLANLSMGGKLLWQLFFINKQLVSELFWKIYLKGGTLKNLQVTNTPTGSITWNLCRRGLELFNQHIYLIPWNDRKHLLWGDKIKGNAPLNTDLSLSKIKLWMVDKVFLRLSNITSWDKKGNWAAWALPALPERDHT